MKLKFSVWKETKGVQSLFFFQVKINCHALDTSSKSKKSLIFTINALKEITDGNLPDSVFDATGSPAAIENAFEYVGHGGRLILVSIVKGKISFEDPLFHAREMSLLSSRNATHEDFSNVMDALRNKHIDINPFVTHRCNFGQVPEIFESWSDPSSRVIKGMVSL